jgi:hypothetical protein
MMLFVTGLRLVAVAVFALTSGLATTLFCILIFFEPLWLLRAISAVVLAYHTRGSLWLRGALAAAAVVLVGVVPTMMALMVSPGGFLSDSVTLTALALLFGGAVLVQRQALALVRRNFAHDRD